MMNLLQLTMWSTCIQETPPINLQMRSNNPRSQLTLKCKYHQFIRVEKKTERKNSSCKVQSIIELFGRPEFYASFLSTQSLTHFKSLFKSFSHETNYSQLKIYFSFLAVPFERKTSFSFFQLFFLSRLVFQLCHFNFSRTSGTSTPDRLKFQPNKNINNSRKKRLHTTACNIRIRQNPSLLAMWIENEMKIEKNLIKYK